MQELTCLKQSDFEIYSAMTLSKPPGSIYGILSNKRSMKDSYVFSRGLLLDSDKEILVFTGQADNDPEYLYSYQIKIRNTAAVTLIKEARIGKRRSISLDPKRQDSTYPTDIKNFYFKRYVPSPKKELLEKLESLKEELMPELYKERKEAGVPFNVVYFVPFIFPGTHCNYR